MYMLVAKAEAGRMMPRARTMYLRVTLIKEKIKKRKKDKIRSGAVNLKQETQ